MRTSFQCQFQVHTGNWSMCRGFLVPETEGPSKQCTDHTDRIGPYMGTTTAHRLFFPAAPAVCVIPIASRDQKDDWCNRLRARIHCQWAARSLRSMRPSLAVSFKWRAEQGSERRHYIIRSVRRVGFTQMASAAGKNGLCGVVVPIYGPVWSVRCFDGPRNRNRQNMFHFATGCQYKNVSCDW